MMKEEVLRVLEAVLAFSPQLDSAEAQFRVEWQEPLNGPGQKTIEAFQREFLSQAPEKKKQYFESSLPRFRFVTAAALRYFPKGGKVLDLGCAPGYTSIILHNLGFEIHGIDLNQLWEETYPDPKWVRELKVQAVNVEQQPLPFGDSSFDGVVFTEVLEHIAISSPAGILKELARVMKPGAMLLLTTPNVCNLANILALAQGKNIFWAPEIFYGSSDRHNREYTPAEVVATVRDAGLEIADQFLFNGPNNWNGSAIGHMYDTLELVRGLNSPLLGNTVFVAAQRQ